MELFEDPNPLESLQDRQLEMLAVKRNLSAIREEIQRRDDVTLRAEDDAILVVEYNTGSLQIYDKSTALSVATISPEDAEKDTIVVYLYQFDKLQGDLFSLEIPAIVVEFDTSLKPVRANWGSVINSPGQVGGSLMYMMNGDQIPPVGSKIQTAKRIAEAIKGHVLGN